MMMDCNKNDRLKWAIQWIEWGYMTWCPLYRWNHSSPGALCPSEFSQNGPFFCQTTAQKSHKAPCLGKEREPVSPDLNPIELVWRWKTSRKRQSRHKRRASMCHWIFVGDKSEQSAVYFIKGLNNVVRLVVKITEGIMGKRPTEKD